MIWRPLAPKKNITVYFDLHRLNIIIKWHALQLGIGAPLPENPNINTNMHENTNINVCLLQRRHLGFGAFRV